MVRAEVLQGVRQMRFEGLLERHERGELLQEEAAEMLGISERTFRRWRDRLRDEGPEGLRDRRIGKPSSRRPATEEILRIDGRPLGTRQAFRPPAQAAAEIRSACPKSACAREPRVLEDRMRFL